MTTVVFGSRDAHPVMIWGKGQKMNLGTCPQGAVTHFQPASDGSGTVTAGGMDVGNWLFPRKALQAALSIHVIRAQFL